MSSSVAGGANDLAHWFPLLRASGVPVPRTEIVHTEVALVDLLDGREPDGFADFLVTLRSAADQIGYPCFLRTGYISGKHDWVTTCYLAEPTHLAAHVVQLVETSELVDLFGLPTDTWVVREFLDCGLAFTAFGGIPIGRERRYFIQDGVVLCHHPYWPAEAFDSRASVPDWMVRLDELNEENPGEVAYLILQSQRVSTRIPGAWSLDWMWIPGRADWYAIDMARAGESFHWPGCNSPVEELRREHEAAEMSGYRKLFRAGSAPAGAPPT